MSLASGQPVESSTFNTWLSNSITEFQRRVLKSTTVDWKAGSLSVTANAKIEIPTSTTIDDSDYTTGDNIYQYLLKKYKKINSNNFPTNYDIAQNTILQALDDFEGYLTIYAADPATSSSTSDTHCSAGCTGLCVDNCHASCSSDSCTGYCTGAACSESACSGSNCSSSCTGNCHGSNCAAGSCAADSCTGNTCMTTCYNSCANSCSVTACKGKCSNSCNANCGDAGICSSGCTSANPCGSTARR